MEGYHPFGTLAPLLLYAVLMRQLQCDIIRC